MSFTYRLHQLPRATQRLARHPKWMAEHVRMALYRRADREQEFRLSNHSPFVVDEHDAVCDVLGVTDAAFQSARERFWAPERDLSEPGASWDARLPLQSLISLCVRLLRPDTMVETGVARGFSTAVSLRAMADVGQGHLYSVELPTLHVGSQREVGGVVDQHLKSRWTLILGPSRQMLPKLVAKVAPIDVFLHDSDHTYHSQIEEYRTAWPRLRPGGVLLSDDIRNDAFVDFAREVNVRPYLIAEADNSALGIMSRP